MDISWEAAQTFLAVAEAGSFSGAAQRLGLGQPTVSRRIALLEEQLGGPLFWRGKRGATLSEDGARLLPAAAQMARFAAEFDRLAQGAASELEGVVRIAAPPGLAVEFLAPFAALVREQHREIRLEVFASVDHIDLSRGGADLAVRTRRPRETGLVTLHSAQLPLAVFASADYARDHAGAATLADLDWITWAAPYEGVMPRPFLESQIESFSPAFASDSYLVQKNALRAGMGAMILERTRHPLAPDDSLREIDAGLSLPPGELHLVCAKSMQFVPRVRAVAGLLIEQLLAADEIAVLRNAEDPTG